MNYAIGYCYANRPLWFLPCTFVLSIIAYFFVFLVRKSDNKIHKSCILITTTIIGCVALYITEEYTDLRFLPWKIDGAIHMLPFFVAGYSFNEYKWWSKILELPFWLKALLWFFLMISGGGLGIINEKAIYHGNYYGNIWIMYVSAMLSCIGICLLSMIIPHIKIFSYFGQHTLGILLMHKFPILLFQKAIPFVAVLLDQQFVPAGLLVVIISMLLCCSVEWIIDRICPIMIGKSNKSNKKTI